MPPFMMEIDAAQRSPLDQLAVDYRPGQPSIGFCRQVYGVVRDVPGADHAVAGRLGIAVSTVRGWRDVGRRASSKWACQ